MNNFQDNGNFTPPTTARLEIPRPSFGQRLKQIRLNREYSLAEAARRSNVRQSTIMELESGDFNNISIAPYYCQYLIENLCIAYECQPNEILEAFELDLHEFNEINGRANATEEPFAIDDAVVGRPPMRLSALLITVLIVFLMALVLCGWLYHRYQRGVVMEEGIKYDLPSLVEPPSLPDTPLQLPTS